MRNIRCFMRQAILKSSGRTLLNAKHAEKERRKDKEAVSSLTCIANFPFLPTANTEYFFIALLREEMKRILN